MRTERSSMKKRILGVCLLAAILCSGVQTGFALSPWVQATASAGWLGRYEFASMAYNSNIWVMGGRTETGTTQLNDVWYSPDGTTWTKATSSADWNSRLYLEGLVFSNKMWVMGGGQWGSTGYKSDVWWSTNGSNWTQATGSAGWKPRAGHGAVVYNGMMWVMGGSDMTNYLNDVWCSSNGVNWVKVADSVAWSPRTGFKTLDHDGKMWILGGSTALGSTNDVWWSSNGVSWVQATASAGWSRRTSLSCCEFDKKMWVLGGTRGGGGGDLATNDVWYSTNGVAWIQETASAPWAARSGAESLTFNNRMWVISGGLNAGGGPYANATDVWYESVPDSDADGIQDWWMVQYFGHPTGQAGDHSLATDDANLDGRSNLQEYLAGTNPTNLVALGDRYVSPAGYRQPPFTNWWGASTNIQSALDAAVEGETIWVGAGTYVGSNNVNLDFKGKNLILKSTDGASATIIDIQNVDESRGIYFHSGETTNAVVDGFTIKNGHITYNGQGGSGIYCDGSSPTIRNCILTSNWTHRDGAGICVYNPCSPRIEKCIFTSNASQWGGGGLAAVWPNAAVTVVGCLFAGNQDYWGAMKFQSSCTGTVYSCTVVSNSASWPGGCGGISCDTGSVVRVVDSIVYGNTGSDTNQISKIVNVQVTYSCVQSGFSGIGNITTSPSFVTGYRLSTVSPCINKGTNMAWMVGKSDLDGTLRISNGTTDMGAYEYGFTIGLRFSAVDITWNSASGITYQVQSCTNLITPNWTNVGSSITATGSSNYVTDWIRDYNGKYYRVTIP